MQKQSILYIVSRVTVFCQQHGSRLIKLTADYMETQCPAHPQPIHLGLSTPCTSTDTICPSPPSRLLLPASDFVYITAIVKHSFGGDLSLLEGQVEPTVASRLRALMLEGYLALQLQKQVIFAAFYYLQKYVRVRSVEQGQMRVLVAGCLLLARKYYKEKRLNLEGWREKLNWGFTAQQVWSIEAQIVLALQFELEPVTRFHHLCDLLLLVDFDQRATNFCFYLAELSLLMNLSTFSEGQIGLSIVRLTCFLLNTSGFQKIPLGELGYVEQRLHLCCESLFVLLKDKAGSFVRQIRKKYRKSCYMGVAKIKFYRKEEQGEARDQEQRDTADEQSN